MIHASIFPKSVNPESLQEYLEFIESYLLPEGLDTRNIHSHHILPRCLGGTDEEENLISLSYTDHAKAHVLLAKAYPNNLSLSHAAYLMTPESEDEELRNMHLENLRSSTIRRNKEYFFMHRGEDEIYVKRVNKETYETLGYIEGMSPSHRKKLGESHVGGHHTEETKRKQREILKNLHVGDIWINNGSSQKTIPPSEFSYYESLGYSKGRLPFSEDHLSNLRKPKSKEHCKNISISAKNRTYTLQCKKCNQSFLGKSWNTKYCNDCRKEKQ